MGITVTYQPIAGNIHQGPGFIVWNLLRPLFGTRPIVGPSTPLQISDPPAPGVWTAGVAQALGAMIVDSNNNVQLVTAISGSGTTGSSQPGWVTAVGAATLDNSGPNQVTWMNAGPSTVWKAGASVLYDQQLRAASGNIWQCIVPGATGATAPSDAGVTYGGLIQDGAALWMNLGPTLTLGASEGTLNFKISAKQQSIQDDQHTAPIDFITTGEDGEIDGTLLELAPLNLSRIMPNAVYASGADALFPAGAQNYQELTFGGQTRVPRPCVGLFSYRRQFGNAQNPSVNPFKWFGGVIYAAGPSSDGSFGFSLKKMTSYKLSAKGSVVAWRPVGDQIGKFFAQI